MKLIQGAEMTLPKVTQLETVLELETECVFSSTSLVHSIVLFHISNIGAILPGFSAWPCHLLSGLGKLFPHLLNGAK